MDVVLEPYNPREIKLPEIKVHDLVECPHCRLVMSVREVQVLFLKDDDVVSRCPNCGEYL